MPTRPPTKPVSPSILRSSSAVLAFAVIPGALSLSCSDTGGSSTPVPDRSTTPAESTRPTRGTEDAALPKAPCGVPATRIIPLDANATESAIAKAVVGAKRGDSIVFAKGTFRLTNTLSLAADGVAICGQGFEETVLDFSGQIAGSDGLYAENVKDFLLSKLTVRDTKGNAVKVLGGERVIFRAVKTDWTGENPSKHGAYGLYPVQSKQILIEDCVAVGASDSGLYIGQSDGIVVRRNRAEGNVAGIEIENSFNADVYENVATHNTAGILVFDLPDLPQLGGHRVRVFNNILKENNTTNFAPEGNVVGKVPAGTGFFVMATHDVEVFGNTFDSNDTANSAIISFLVTQIPINDKKYDPYPARVYFHGNTYVGGGTNPDKKSHLGLLLSANSSVFDGARSPDVFYDGMTDGTKPDSLNPMDICVKLDDPTKPATFANMHLDKLSEGSLDLRGIVSKERAAYDCTLPPLPKVVLPGIAE